MMKKILIVTSLLLVGCLMPCQTHANTIHMLSPYYCPLLCDPEREYGKEGFVVDILRRIFEPAGYTLEITFKPYARVLGEMQAGKYGDAVFAGVPRISDSLILPERALAPQRVAFLVKAGNAWTYQGVDSLKTIRLGIVQGYSTMVPELDAYLAGAESPAVQALVGENYVERNFIKLLKERVDVVLEGEFTTFYQLYKMGASEKIAIAGYSPVVFQNSPGFHPDHPQAEEFARMVEIGMVTLRETGELAEIVSRYGISLWPEEFELRE